ncbi:ABC transporter substrate-binding protein [Nocardiopsis sp. N85]|uniref:ABC transporter substrate-binding protein n=1 Tax=Nocardiopsis sp. N85 TaxID=3029400 RepID=UPI00237F1D72|nr:ABC transporter substrate-binding protein [Nocardiopsis sp. N85]MDE3721610.1 ABC transporter substrate-binding protein [Nocardiopsis sp. N85]
MRIAHRLPVALLGATLALTACGDTGDDPESTGTPEPGTDTAAAVCAPPEADPNRPTVGDGTFPVTLTDAVGEVTVEEAPERIVSLSPSHTEMLFAIGAGERVEAADEYSNFPAEAPTTDLSGFTPSVEAIVEYDPDLVVMSDSAQETAAQLADVDIPTLVMPAAADLEDTYAQIRLLGDATGHAEDADAEATRIETEFTKVVEEVCAEAGDAGLSFYQELDETPFSATSETFVGQIYSSFGLVNIADAADDGTAGGYPQLSQEYIVEENPDLIFLSYGDEAAVEAVAERPAFDTVTAVRNDAVYLLDADIASRWGPRVVDFARLVGDTVLDNTAN